MGLTVKTPADNFCEHCEHFFGKNPYGLLGNSEKTSAETTVDVSIKGFVENLEVSSVKTFVGLPRKSLWIVL